MWWILVLLDVSFIRRWVTCYGLRCGDLGNYLFSHFMMLVFSCLWNYRKSVWILIFSAIFRIAEASKGVLDYFKSMGYLGRIQFTWQGVDQFWSLKLSSSGIIKKDGIFNEVLPKYILWSIWSFISLSGSHRHPCGMVTYETVHVGQKIKQLIPFSFSTVCMKRYSILGIFYIRLFFTKVAVRFLANSPAVLGGLLNKFDWITIISLS